jgi:sorting nexin-1/2
MNKYTSYRVDVRPPPQQNDEPNLNQSPDDVFQNTGHSAVLRRYSDFLWLYERLHKERAGGIIPPLPEKQAVSRFSSTFIEERRVNLERYLRRIAVHPELYDAPSLDTFLRADDVTFHTAKNSKGSSSDAAASMMMSMSMSINNANIGGGGYPSPNPAMMAPTPPKKDGIKKWFAETKTSIAGDLVRSPDDDLFVEIERYIDGLEKQMKNVQQQASGLVKKGKEIANGLFEFGLAFNVLGQSEADDLGNALSKMGTAADELSAVSMSHSEKEMMQFEEPLKDYLKTIHAVKLALQKRQNKRLTYTTSLSEVNTKRANLAKLRATPGAEAKAYGAEMSLKRGEGAADVARDEFATVSQRVLREVDRFKREKGDEMRRVVLDYITLQIDYNKKMEQVWAELLPKLEAIQVPGSFAGDNVNSGASNSGSSNDGTGIPTNVVTGSAIGAPNGEEVQVHDLSQPQHQHGNNIYQPHMNVGQNMLGLEGSVQYRDNTDLPISGM